MRYTTEYLFDKPLSAYEPHQTILARRKIIDGRALMKRLAHERSHGFADAEATEYAQKRYLAVQEAVKWWEDMIETEV